MGATVVPRGILNVRVAEGVERWSQVTALGLQASGKATKSQLRTRLPRPPPANSELARWLSGEPSVARARGQHPSEVMPSPNPGWTQGNPERRRK